MRTTVKKSKRVHDTIKEKNITPRSEDILKAATHLFSQKGYSETTLDNIAQLARVNKASVYYYFKNKAFLLFEIVCRATNSTLALAEPIVASDLSPIDKLKELVINHMKWRLDNIGIGGIGEKELRNLPPRLRRDYTALRDSYEAIFRKIHREAIDAGEVRHIDNKIASLTILSFTNSFDRWFKPDGELSADEIASIAWEFIYRALEPREAGISIKNSSTTKHGT